MNPEIFRAYDIRGVVGKDFEPHDFYTIAQAYARIVQPRTVAVGHDARATSPDLWQQVVEGLTEAGVDVLNIGANSTDMLYFATVNYQTDGGIIVSASHNPAEYNGMKLVRAGAVPISGDSGLMDIRDEAIRQEKQRLGRSIRRGVVRSAALMEDYLQHLRYFVDFRVIGGKKLVMNANSGYAGIVAKRLLADTTIEYVPIFTEPDGTFSQIPNGRPDPLRPENRTITEATVRKSGADLAVAWDADADRCFFFDENAEFIEGSYITGLIAELLLKERGSAPIIFDPRVVWPVEECVKRAGGTPIINKCGHSFFKERMRKEDGLFGGESSAHYYFRRNFYADNGMVPFLLVLQHLCKSGQKFSEWVGPLRRRYPVSGEINYKFPHVDHARTAFESVREALPTWGQFVEEPPIDGLSVHYLVGGRPTWRFNLRASNTEAVIRLNAEAIEDEDLLRKQTEAVGAVIEAAGGKRDTEFRWEK